jgi:hypothetical protein
MIFDLILIFFLISKTKMGKMFLVFDSNVSERERNCLAFWEIEEEEKNNRKMSVVKRSLVSCVVCVLIYPEMRRKMAM